MTVARMAAARRSGRAGEAVTLQLGAATVASAGCSVHTANAAGVSVAAFYPADSVLTPAAAELQRLAARFAEDGTLAAGRLHGTFLLVAHDATRARAAVANDRFAVCPLYATTDGTTLRFASDLAALVAGGTARPTVDAQAIYDYVFFHCIPAPRTIYQGVRKLGPATCLRWQDGMLDSTPYWQPGFA
ncbi:MAG: hypothetical protein RLW62_18490, partial [Gammaproteobacteria bacterium]